MKQRMMMKKSLMCLAFVVVLLMLTIISPMATPASKPQAENPVQWALSEDGDTLTGDDVTYLRVKLPAGYSIFEEVDTYAYNQQVIYNYYSVYQVYSYAEGGWLVWLYNQGEKELFVKEGYEQKLSQFLQKKGEFGEYAGGLVYTNQQIPTNGYIKLTDVEAVAGLDNSSAKNQTMDVTDLKPLDRVQILGLEAETKVIACVLGDLYVLEDGRYGYVSYATLENNHFDADGNFSYRQGQVDVAILDEETAKTLAEDIQNGVYYVRNVSYEGDNEDLDEMAGLVDSTYSDTTITVFWITFVFLGYLLPIAPMVVGLVFTMSRKMSNPRRWLIVVGLAGLWIVLSILLTVFLLV